MGFIHTLPINTSWYMALRKKKTIKVLVRTSMEQIEFCFKDLTTLHNDDTLHVTGRSKQGSNVKYYSPVVL